MARHIPQSAPGTIFGIPVARLRDAALQRKMLFFAGIALIASIIVPYHIHPTGFAWDLPDKFDTLIWPIIAGAAYLLLTAAPPHIRQQIPPIVLHWLPFAVAFIGVFVAKVLVVPSTLLTLGYAVLVFGLLARIAQPQDQIARIIIAVGAGMLVPDYLDLLRVAFHFSGGIFEILYSLLFFLVLTLGILCILFVVPPAKLPPALQSLDAFAPLITAVLILWLPLNVIIFMLAEMVQEKALIGPVLMGAHLLLPVLAYFGVLMMTSPAAYEEATALITGRRPPGSGHPPQGYPPQGGGYPPQGGGYPPQGGGYPPQGGGYPPQGGGYPPQGGGGYPPQGGGGWPQ